MTADTNTQLLMDRIDVCNDATLERLETIIEVMQEIRESVKPKEICGNERCKHLIDEHALFNGCKVLECSCLQFRRN